MKHPRMLPPPELDASPLQVNPVPPAAFCWFWHMGTPTWGEATWSEQWCCSPRGPYHFSEQTGRISQSTNGTLQFWCGLWAVRAAYVVILLEQGPFGWRQPSIHPNCCIPSADWSIQLTKGTARTSKKQNNKRAKVLNFQPIHPSPTIEPLHLDIPLNLL